MIQSLLTSDMLQAGDTILLSPLEHHANIVPWQMAVEQVGCMIERMDLTEDLSLDMFSLQQKAQKAKIVSIAHVSNVTGEIFDLQHIQSLLPETSLFVVDASQSAPHIPLDVQKIACDFCGLLVIKC
ncbi:MAG: aminotransferase class V-fold PLP-dependent enzyme [Candidatus Peribacteria bacterium]|nr:MAG: aminotransferase class V-fold PLP-dependent enzyme [Candidatus Peribacteria bacterium]